ncbi:MAG: hypothetical protein AAGL98_00195 [Planctomycetota bacterium]
MVQIVNAGVLGGGFKHYSGLLPVINGAGDPTHASVRIFHIPSTNAAAIYRGDIAVLSSASIGVQGGGDLPNNVSAPSASVVVGNGGGSGLGNASMAPNITRWVPGDTTSVIAGVIVGWGPITLYQAKNGFQYAPANTECWAFVETDPQIEMQATVPTVPGTAFNLTLMDGIDVKANAGFQSTRFGISGVSLDPATINTTSTLPLRILNSSEQIGNDPTAAGFVAKVNFNKTRHAYATGGFVAD